MAEQNRLTQDDWISVEDQIPEMRPIYKDGPRASGTVITFNGHYVHVGKYEETFTKRRARWIGPTGYVVSVTHWMPLPKGPTKKP